MTIAERIMLLIENSNLRASDVADTLKISRSNLTRWKQKEYIPSTEHIIALSELFDVTTDWILTGDEKKAVCIEPSINKIEPNLSIDEETLLDNYRDMTTDGKRKAQKEIKYLREEHKKSKGILSTSDQEKEMENFPIKNSDVG